MNGYRSHIFEHHSQPGGVAAAWRRGEYLIDGGIHFVMGHKPGTGLYKMYQQLGIVPATRFVDLTTYGRFSDEASGTQVDITQDLERLARDLKALSPADAKLVENLVAGARAFEGTDMSEMGLSKPPELMGPFDQLKDLWGMRRLFRYFVGRYGQPVADYARDVHDPVLRVLLENLFLPEAPVYFVLMVLGSLASGELGLIDGSCLDFVGAMEARYEALGGEVTYQATVEKILVEGDAAVGVRLQDGSEHRAAAVVSAADGRSTIYDMLGGRYVDARIKERYDTWPRFQPLLMVSYGVNREFPNVPPFSTLILERPFNIGADRVEGIWVRVFNYSSRFAPSGKTVVQAELESNWEFWYNLQRDDRSGYQAEKERVAWEILQRLEAHFPGISANVELTDVGTPYSWWRYTLNDRGAWMGWLMTPQAIRTLLPRTLPGLSRFYMAGQWVTPGGGVSPVLYTGRHAVQLLCREDGRPFVAET
jgi:phytoene dehydrogenase-like protein